MNKRSIPLFMTIAVLLLIVFVAVIARWSLNSREKRSVTVITNDKFIADETGLNESERVILMRISSLIVLPNVKIRKESGNQTIYLKILYDYLRSPGVELGENTASEIKELIKQRDELMYLENENEISRMSFDGRKAAIYILKRIYELCGLNLELDMSGEIEKITDQTGTITYQKKNLKEHAGVQVESLLITITVILALLSICFIIARKNQIFEKGGRYDGFDEKKIA